jgi:hypothetical protein
MLKDLMQYPQWAEQTTAAAADLEADSLAYICDDFRVTTDCLDWDNAEAFLLTEVTPEWQTFCKEELNFEVPDFEAEAKEARAKAQSS